MLFLFALGVAIVKICEELAIGAAVAVFDDVDVARLVECDGNFEMVLEGLLPVAILRLQYAQRRAGEHEVVVPVRQIIAIHECSQLVDQAQIHAAQQKNIFARRRVAAVDFAHGHRRQIIHGRVPCRGAGSVMPSTAVLHYGNVIFDP